MTCPPVSMAMSSSIDFLLSPNPGALTAATLSPPLSLFTTKVASASPSTSSAIINNGLPDLTTASSSGSKSCKLDNFPSFSKMNGSSNSQIIFSASVIK